MGSVVLLVLSLPLRVYFLFPPSILGRHHCITRAGSLQTGNAYPDMLGSWREAEREKKKGSLGGGHPLTPKNLPLLLLLVFCYHSRIPELRSRSYPGRSNFLSLSLSLTSSFAATLLPGCAYLFTPKTLYFSAHRSYPWSAFPSSLKGNRA